MVEEDAPEQSRVAEDEGLVALTEEEVIVIAGDEGGGFVAEFAGHAEVESEPGVLRETEEHLFAARFGGEKFCAGQKAEQGWEVVATKDSFVGVQVDFEDRVAEADIPAAAEVFYFGEFRHGE